MIKAISNVGNLTNLNHSRNEKVLVLGVKYEGSIMPIEQFYAHINAAIYYHREKNSFVEYDIITLDNKQILKLEDIEHIIENSTNNYPTVRVVTFSPEVYRAFIKGQDLLKSKFKDKIILEYVGNSIVSMEELDIPSRVFFVFSCDKPTINEGRKSFAKETYNVYRCQGYSTDKIKSLPFKNDYERSILLEDKEFNEWYNNTPLDPIEFMGIMSKYLKPKKYRKEEEDRL